ncbi:MAG: translation initiation factor IF-3, partial [Myxococcota bacterium]
MARRSRNFGRDERNNDEPRINRAIRAREVRVIDPDGQQLGIMSAYDALDQAEEFGLDLVEVAP